MKYVLVFVLAAFLTGCGKTVTTPVPGAVDVVDSMAYQNIATAQGALKSFKDNFGALTQAQQIFVKPFLNDALKAYDVAEAAGKAYHAGTGDPQALATALGELTRSLANLQGAMPQKKGGN